MEGIRCRAAHAMGHIMSRDDAQSFAPPGARGKLFAVGIGLLAIHLAVAPAGRAQTTSPATRPTSAPSAIQAVGGQAGRSPTS